MLSWLARFLIRRRAPVLGTALAALVLARAFGAGAVGRLKTGGFDDPAAESSRAATTLRDTFHTGDPNVVLLVTARKGTVDDERLAARAEQLAAAFESDRSATSVQVGGVGRLTAEIQDQVERDLTKAEGIAIPITLLLLVVVFSSVVAGALEKTAPSSSRAVGIAIPSALVRSRST